MQKDLFGNTQEKKATGLTIAKPDKQPLSKSQAAFNKLVQKIEKLQKEIEKKQLQLEFAMKIYGTDYQQAMSEMLKVRHRHIIVLWKNYESKKLSKVDQRHLKVVLQHQVGQYFSLTKTEPDKIMQEIFSQLEGIDYDTMMDDEKNRMIAETKKMFSNINVETDGLDFDDMEAVAAKIAEAHEKMAAIDEEEQKKKEEKEKRKSAKKNKPGKQQEYEKLQKHIAEANTKNISSIYRQLAKLFHPDLEQDAERKLEKEILMKELTAAFEAKDLHLLLTLELKWIHKENDHLASLTEERLNAYLQILKEQATNLEKEKYEIVHQPRFAVLLDALGFDFTRNPVAAIERELNEIATTTKHLESDISLFESDHGLRHIKAMIKAWKQAKEGLEDEDFLNMLLEDEW